MRPHRLALVVTLAALVPVAPATAQDVFTPPNPSVFGAPSLAGPRDAPETKPDLPSPQDVPNATTSAAKDPNVDLAFGAYQRGFYATAMREAMRRLSSKPDDGAAMTLVGELYAQGLGVKADKVEAVRWYALGAAAGDTPAMLELGLARMRGEGVRQDREGARAMFAAAAARDNPGALFYLGLMALQGNGVASDARAAADDFTDNEPFHKVGAFESVLVRRWRQMRPEVEPGANRRAHGCRHLGRRSHSAILVVGADIGLDRSHRGKIFCLKSV